jgi:hypothetical protein
MQNAQHGCKSHCPAVFTLIEERIESWWYMYSMDNTAGPISGSGDLLFINYSYIIHAAHPIQAEDTAPFSFTVKNSHGKS